MSSYSNQLTRDIERMKHEMTATLPKEMASAANLMVHPAAGAMALSALGFGLASQAAGTWLGAMTAAAEVSQRFWQPLVDELQERAGSTAAAVLETQLQAAAPQPDAQTSQHQAVPVATVSVARSETAVSKPKQKKAAAALKPVTPSAKPAVPAAISRPDRPDDLKAIAGIGPKLEQVLNAQGIWTYAQIAAWTASDIARFEEMLGFPGRIGRDGWIAQAGGLFEAYEAAKSAGGK